jgi:hypothetical protein
MILAVSVRVAAWVIAEPETEPEIRLTVSVRV